MGRRNEVTGLLTQLGRGAAAYEVYLSCCRMYSVRSEYLFYEPLARIAVAAGWRFGCEVDAGLGEGGRGDRKRIDFVFWKAQRDQKSKPLSLALEVKRLSRRAPNGGLNVSNELEKLGADRFKDHTKAILIFGRLRFVEPASLDLGEEEDRIFSTRRCKLFSLESGNLKYAAKWFILVPT